MWVKSRPGESGATPILVNLDTLNFVSLYSFDGKSSSLIGHRGESGQLTVGTGTREQCLKWQEEIEIGLRGGSLFVDLNDVEG